MGEESKRIGPSPSLLTSLFGYALIEKRRIRALGLFEIAEFGLQLMHIPDGLMNNATSVVTGVVGASGLGVGLWSLRGRERDRTMVQMGMTAAFVFAAQMVNFQLYPLPVSGHFLGGVLAAAMVGPWAGAVVIASVLIVQCLLFGDGGVTALGANFINMGLIGSALGYVIYSPLRRWIGGRAGVVIGAMIAAWFSVLLAAGAFSLEFAVSGHGKDFFKVMSWMVLVHAAIGLGEALITGMILRFVLLARPDLLEVQAPGPTVSNRPLRWVQTAAAGLAIALAIAIFLAPLASDYSDGLEWVGGRLGFSSAATSLVKAPIPDYKISGLSHATAAAGVVGTILVFGLGVVLARVFATGKPAPGGIAQHAA